MNTGTSSNRPKIWKEFLLRTFWYGGSSFDAWLNIACVKISARILSLPKATAGLGLPSAIIIQMLHFAIGLWSSCIVNVLYLEHRRKRQEREPENSTTQLHEVIGGLLGPRWGAVSLFFNAASLFTASSFQFLICANMVYALNDELDKRTWVLIFCVVFFPSVFTPTAHNYKVLSFVGVAMTIFSSAYLSMAPLLQGKAPNVKYTTPRSYTTYFSSIAGCIYFAHIIVPVELMDGMWKPQDFPKASAFGTLYSIVVGMTPTLCIYIIFGDRALDTPNALELLPASTFRGAAVILMAIHQAIFAGIVSVGIYTVWEKMLGVHGTSSYTKRTLCRIPVFLALWLAALAFPFFDRGIAVLDTTFILWNLHLVPCAAYIAAFWSKSSRRLHTPFSRLGWSTDFSINFGILLWVVIVDSALCAPSSISQFIESYRRYRNKHASLFASCYACNPHRPS